MKQRILILTLLLFTCNFIEAKRKKIIVSPALRYRTIEPLAKTNNPPIIYLLHGYGSNENDLASLSDQLPENAIKVSIRAPFLIADSSYKWYDIRSDDSTSNEIQIKESCKTFHRIHKHFSKKFPSSKYQIIGFSQGAIMAYHIALTQPHQIDKIVALGGRLIPSTTNKIINHKTKIFIGHGINDDRINISEAKAALAILQANKLNCTYKTYPIQHSISNQEMLDVKKWLEE